LVVSPAFHPEEKLAVLSALADRFHALPVVKNLLGVLVAKGRIRLLPEITKAFVALIEHGQGTRHITVLSARELDTTEQEQLRYRLHELLRRDVSVTFQTEPRLLGGLTIRIGSHLYDSSVRSRLNAMQTLLTGE
jgi:F-type H+-transporting ATPase subunit delta